MNSLPQNPYPTNAIATMTNGGHQSEIPSQMSRLGNRHAELAKMIEELFSRIQSVMRPEPPAACDKTPKPGPVSPLADQISDEADKVEQMIAAVCQRKELIEL